MKPLSNLRIKFFGPRNSMHKTETIAAPRGAHIEEGPSLDAAIRALVEEYAKSYPGDVFESRVVGRGVVNVVWVGRQDSTLVH